MKTGAEESAPVLFRNILLSSGLGKQIDGGLQGPERTPGIGAEEAERQLRAGAYSVPISRESVSGSSVRRWARVCSVRT